MHVPSHVTHVCRCGRHVLVRFAAATVSQNCPACGGGPADSLILLAPRVQRRRKGRRLRASGAHDDAIWAVLVLGLTLLVVIVAALLG
ncbi:MAG: hypothetical protein AB1716_05965 [Planctomycetota bacterium]